MTQPRAFGAFTGREYGSFSGKDSSLPVGELTQPRAFGAFAGRRYGSFAGRTTTPTIQAGGGSFRRSIRIHVPPEKRSNDDDEVMFVLEVALKFLTKQ